MTGINMFWRGSVLDSKNFFAAAMELVMMMMLWTFSSFMVGIRPKHMAMSSASIEVTFIELACRHWTREFSDHMCATAVVTCDFLIPLSAMMAMLWGAVWDDLKAWLRFCMWW